MLIILYADNFVNIASNVLMFFVLCYAFCLVGDDISTSFSTLRFENGHWFAEENIRHNSYESLLTFLSKKSTAIGAVFQTHPHNLLVHHDS